MPEVRKDMLADQMYIASHQTNVLFQRTSVTQKNPIFFYSCFTIVIGDESIWALMHYVNLVEIYLKIDKQFHNS